MVLAMARIKEAEIKIAVDPLGGSSLPYWEPIAEQWDLNIDVVNPTVDPRFSFIWHVKCYAL